MTLSQLAKSISILPQVLVNARVTEEFTRTYGDNKTINDAIRKLESEFKGQGRVLIRPSGTEPLVRVMIEGKDQTMIEKKAYALAKLIEETCK